jgi:hypothetical protein
MRCPMLMPRPSTALLSDPLPQPIQSDTEAVARIGIAFARLARQDSLHEFNKSGNETSLHVCRDL